MNNNIFEKEGLQATVNALTGTDKATDIKKAFKEMYDLGYKHGQIMAEKEAKLKALKEELLHYE